MNKNDPIEICFLDWSPIWRCLEKNNYESQQTISVKLMRGKSFRVWGSKNPLEKAILVNQNALSDWDVPGV